MERQADYARQWCVQTLVLLLYNCCNYANLVDLFIDPEFRGNGYGRQMLQEAGRIAKEQGCLRVQWATQHGNPARKLYDELGVCNFVEYRMQI